MTVAGATDQSILRLMVSEMNPHSTHKYNALCSETFLDLFFG